MRIHSDLRPALAASVGLHAAVVVAVFVALHLSSPVKLLPPVVPVTIVSNIGEANERPAETASERRPASTPEPAPEPAPSAALPMPPAPPKPSRPAPRRQSPIQEPAPEPVPDAASPPEPKATAKSARRVARDPAGPAPTAKIKERAEPPPRPEAKAATEPGPAPRPKDLDLGALAKTAPRRAATNSALDLAALGSAASAKAGRADLDLSALADAPARRSASARGPSHAETDRLARQAVGAATSLTGDQLSALQAKIIPLWHPICDVQGATSVVVKVELRLDAGHQLASPPRLAGQSSSGASDDVMSASARRALTAVAQGAPYDMLPNTAPRVIIVAFHAKDACSGR